MYAIGLCMSQKCFGLPVGTYRLGIALLSDDTLSEQKLYKVEMNFDADSDYECVSDKMHDTTIGKSFFTTNAVPVSYILRAATHT